MPRIIGRYWPILGNLAILANTKYWPIILTVRLFKSTLNLLRQVTEVGAYVKSAKFRKIDLGSCIRQDLTPCLINGQEMTVQITPEALESSLGIGSLLSKKALDSITAVLLQQPL